MHFMPMDTLRVATTIVRDIPHLYMRYKIAEAQPVYASFPGGNILSQYLSGNQYCISLHYLFLLSAMQLQLQPVQHYPVLHCMLQGEITLHPAGKAPITVHENEYVFEQHTAGQMVTVNKGMHLHCSIQIAGYNMGHTPYPGPIPAAIRQLLRTVLKKQDKKDEDFAVLLQKMQQTSEITDQLLQEIIPNRNKIYQVKEYLQQHYSDAISIKQLSQLFTINEYHLKKDFKRLFGTTIHSFQIGQRINNAKDLLIKNDLSVEEIANATGFYDHSHFSKQFKSTTGHSPSGFLECVKNGQCVCA